MVMNEIQNIMQNSYDSIKDTGEIRIAIKRTKDFKLNNKNLIVVTTNATPTNTGGFGNLHHYQSHTGSPHSGNRVQFMDATSIINEGRQNI